MRVWFSDYWIKSGEHYMLEFIYLSKIEYQEYRSCLIRKSSEFKYVGDPIQTTGRHKPYSDSITPDHFFAVLIDGGTDVGTISYTFHSRKKCAKILDLEIFPQHRRKGLASAAVEIVINGAKKIHISVIRLFVHHTRTPAMELYNKLGFEKTRVFDNGFSMLLHI